MNGVLERSSMGADLMRDAMDTMDLMAQAPSQVSNRRAVLIDLVTTVCQRDGQDRSLHEIETAVDQLLTRQALMAGLTAPVPTLSERLSTAKSGLGAAVDKLSGWWGKAWTAPFAKPAWISCVTAGLIFWFPWKALFLLSITHPAAFFSGTLFLTVFSILGLYHCDGSLSHSWGYLRVEKAKKWCWAGIYLGSALIACGILCRHTGTATDDSEALINKDAPAVHAAMNRARHDLGPGASFETAVRVANGYVHDDRSTTRGEVGTFVKGKPGVIEWVAELNPTECQSLTGLDPVFVVASVNGNPVTAATDMAAACTYPWDNAVGIQNLPGKL